MNSESLDKQTRHVSDVQRFEGMPTEELESKLYESKTNTIDRWEGCNKSLKLLFDVLNSSNAGHLDLYDIKTDEVSYNGSTFEKYIRIWKDRHTNEYKTKPKIRIDGFIDDYDFQDTESFGDTYEYRFGTAHSHVAKIKMQDITGGGIKLERSDGKIVSGLTHHESAILMSAMDGMILPSIEKIEDTLVMLWSAFVQDDLNPVHAQSARTFFNR